MIRSNANYLERAQNIQSIDDFECIISDVISSLNESKVAPSYEVQDHGGSKRH